MKLSVLILAILFLSPVLISGLATASLGVTDITPTFYSIQLYFQNGRMFVKTVVFDYNSWRSIDSVRFSATGASGNTVEQVTFYQYGNNGTSDTFVQTSGSAFIPSLSWFNASDLVQTVSQRCNLTVTFAFAPFNAQSVTISTTDIHGKTAESSIQIASGYLGTGIQSAEYVIPFAAAIGTVLLVVLRSRRVMNIEEDRKAVRKRTGK